RCCEMQSPRLSPGGRSKRGPGRSLGGGSGRIITGRHPRAYSCIDREQIAQAKNAISLPSLIGSHIRLEKAGRLWRGLCPFHSEKTPSFNVWADHYHCFGCGRHGDALTWLIESGELSFQDALAELGALEPNPGWRNPQTAQRTSAISNLELAREL